jgi:hypothetical protein
LSLTSQIGLAWDAPLETSSVQGTHLDFGHVHPATVFWWMKLQPIQDALGFGWREYCPFSHIPFLLLISFKMEAT